MRRTFDQLKDQRGQAIVEYILLLVVVIALILGPLKQFSKSFNGYITALFGRDQYYSCLLETGELGGQSSDASSSCSATLKASVDASMAGQNQQSSSGSSGSSGSSTSSSETSQDSSTSQSSKKPSVTTAQSGSSDSSNQSSSTSDSAFNNAGLSAGANQRNRPPSQQVVGKATTSNEVGDSFEKMNGEQFDYKNLRPKNGFEVSSGKLDRRFEEESEEAKRANKLAPKEVASTNSKNLRNKELSFDPSRAPASKDDDVNTEGFGFSMLLKWLLIAGIIIALIVFVGGQAMQISKGGEN